MPWAGMWRDLPCAAAAIVACLLFAMLAAAENDTRCLEGLKDSLYDPYGYLNWNFGNQNICSFNGVNCWSDSNNKVQSLSLHNMALSGQIPPALQYCASTTRLDLSHNWIAGEIPAQLCTWLPFLVYLDLSGNSLSGPIPDLSHCTNLVTLHLSRNNLSGPIPDLSHCTNLNTLDFSSNHLSGQIHPTLSLLIHLNYINLAFNHLSGPIPDLSHCTNLDTLYLSGNSLSGPIPDLSHCTNLVTLHLSGNNLSGPIPDLSHCTNLYTLDLSSNSLSGPIPDLSHCTNFVTLDLSDNSLSGPIPDLSHCTNLDTLDLYGNSLSGPIPDLSHCTNLVNLHLSRNLLSGPIPDLSHCTNLNTLDLSSNNLSGQIPPTLCLLVRLEYVNLAYNKLSNCKLCYFEAFAFSDNGALCGRPLPNYNGKTFNASLTIIIVPVILGVPASLLIIYSAYRWYLNQSMAELPVVPLVEDHQRIRDWVEHPADLSFLAEGDGVAALELVGRGGCGDVYRAQLAGKTIAIKKIVKMGPYEKDSGVLDRRTRQARSEIITVGRIRHQNLLPLLAHVPRPDCNYLVYEFMNNGSLHDAIVGTNGLRLDWLARYGIAVGIATGLEYLHHHHKPYLIHRDLKPENILLDEDLKARISDFGLAKEFPDDAQTHMSMSKVAGTIGYIAPEYYQTLKFTTKCDIYSLGVILATLVTGKLPTDDFFQDTEEMSMVMWLRNVMGSAEADLRAVIDERLLGRGFQKQMVLVLKISCFCTADDPKHRPTSTDVRCMLSQIKH